VFGISIQASPTPTIMPTAQAVIYQPTTAPIFVPTAKPAYVDPDPVVDCVSSAPNCNGSSIRARKSQCSKITCCQISSSWSVYSSSEDCTKAQTSANPAPAQVTNPSTGLNYYCYDNTYKNWYYTSSGEQCNTNNIKSACEGLVKVTYDICMNNCLNTAHQNSSTCVYTYNNYSSSEYQQCIDKKDADQKSCDNTCSIEDQNGVSRCDSIK